MVAGLIFMKDPLLFCLHRVMAYPHRWLWRLRELMFTPGVLVSQILRFHILTPS